MKIWRGLLVLLILVLAGGALFAVCARQGLLTPSEAALRAKYALPNSKFMTIDGEPIHYVDEGQGDAIVLIHGSFSSLLAWNDWAKALKDHYRVIRFDDPPMGLSGPDPQGRYDLARNDAMLEQLTAKLGVRRFFLVATSSGGALGAAYAADHPDQMKGVILSNIAVGTFKVSRDHLPWLFKTDLAIEPLFNGWRSPLFWREVLTSNFYNPRKVTAAEIAQWGDLNNRSQRMPRNPTVERAPDFGRTAGDLAKITAPTLLLWSANDGELPAHPTADKGLALLGAHDKAIVLVPNCGHIIAVECGPEGVVPARAFFDRIAVKTP